MKKQILTRLSEHYVELDKIIGSILVSLILLSQCFFAICELAFGNTWPYKIVLLIGAVFSFFYFEKQFSVKQFFVFFGIAAFSILTLIYRQQTNIDELLEYFLIYGLAAFAMSFCKIDESFLFRCCVFFGILWLGLYFLNYGFHINDTFYFGYTILPIVIASFLLITTKKHIVLICFDIVIFALLFVLLLTSGSRGPVLCFFIFGFIHFLPCIKKLKHAIIYLVVLASFIAILANIVNIVTLIYNAMPGKISFIDKTYRLIVAEQDFSNGRFEIIERIFQQYKFTDFIIGIGVGTYGFTHPVEGYTHNIFMSALLDFGLIGLAFIIYIIVLFFIKLFKNRGNILYLEMVLTLSIITLFFSQDYWKSFPFWLFVFLMTKNEEDAKEQNNAIALPMTNNVAGAVN